MEGLDRRLRLAVVHRPCEMQQGGKSGIFVSSCISVPHQMRPRVAHYEFLASNVEVGRPQRGAAHGLLYRSRPPQPMIGLQPLENQDDGGDANQEGGRQFRHLNQGR
jgi:hypothetical protein